MNKTEPTILFTVLAILLTVSVLVLPSPFSLIAWVALCGWLLYGVIKLW